MTGLDTNVLVRVLVDGMTLYYEYDFGSTTHLELKVIERSQGCFPDQRAGRQTSDLTASLTVRRTRSLCVLRA
ncbi:hypothetical protein MYX84_06545, partial [Acidobacteria bacterium AH-259-O06]|nr:hypothetical protein [Acidobacteria bacterium AH-259-O06]